MNDSSSSPSMTPIGAGAKAGVAEPGSDAAATGAFLALDGAWALHFHDGERGLKPAVLQEQTVARNALAAVVPGDVHLDLMRAGLIEDPASGLHSLAARWVEDAIWTYQKCFDWESREAGTPVWLEFERLSGVAEVFLNGMRVGCHANDFLPARFEVSGLLKPGPNLLVVQMEAGQIANADAPGLPYAPNLLAASTKRMWSRKPQCQFGWDWAPRLLNVGIAGSVRLVWSEDALRVDQVVPVIALSDDLQDATVSVCCYLENAAASPQSVRVTASLPGLGVVSQAACDLALGLQPVGLELRVSAPPLWWPRGHGEPHTEPLLVEVESSRGGRHAVELEVGFRKVHIDQSPHPQSGSFFILKINNRPIFCRGGNFVPPDLLACRTDAARIATLMDRAEELNFNFLRVWGGGFYESEEFYREADRRGFLVWQDMIYACSRYPLEEPTFFREATEEARWQVRRLARHPSLVVLCGNNEIETAQWNWGWEKQGRHAPDHAFFHITLARLVQSECPGLFYWPSSPYSPYDRTTGILPNPIDDDTGDQHPWSLGFWDTDFRKYRAMVCRFPNEGGVLGPPSLPTLRECLPPGHEHLGSFAWLHHENSVAYWSEPSVVGAQITQWTGISSSDLTLEEYVYWAGLVQGEGLREYCENFRRRMFDSAAAVFWMFNDTWPTVRSWAPVDYFLRRAPCFHPVRRALQPVHVVLVEEGDSIAIYGINDTPEPVAMRLDYGVFHFAGDYPERQSAEVSLTPNASQILATLPLTTLTNDTENLAFAVLHSTAKLRGIVARSRLLRELPARWKLPPPEIDITLRNGKAVFHSPRFVWGACLDLAGEKQLADNFFDLFPGQPHEIPWPFPDPPRILFTGNRLGRG